MFASHILIAPFTRYLIKVDPADRAPKLTAHAIHEASEDFDAEEAAKYLIRRCATNLLPPATYGAARCDHRRLTRFDYGYAALYLGGRLLTTHYDANEHHPFMLRLNSANREDLSNAPHRLHGGGSYSFSARVGRLHRHVAQITPGNYTTVAPLKLKYNTSIDRFNQFNAFCSSTFNMIDDTEKVPKVYSQLDGMVHGYKRWVEELLTYELPTATVPGLGRDHFPLLRPLAELETTLPNGTGLTYEQIRTLLTHFVCFYREFVAEALLPDPMTGQPGAERFGPWDVLPRRLEGLDGMRVPGAPSKSLYCVPTDEPVISHALRAYARLVYVSEKLYKYFDYDDTVTDSICASIMIDKSYKDFSKSRACGQASWQTYDSTIAERADLTNTPLSHFYGSAHPRPSRFSLRAPEEIMNSKQRSTRLQSLVRKGLYDYDNLLAQYNTEEAVAARAAARGRGAAPAATGKIASCE